MKQVLIKYEYTDSQMEWHTEHVLVNAPDGALLKEVEYKIIQAKYDADMHRIDINTFEILNIDW